MLPLAALWNKIVNGKWKMKQGKVMTLVDKKIILYKFCGGVSAAVA
jgi:hypothetical protein